MRASKHQDLTGKRFGKLLVVEECQKRGKFNMIEWLCVCDCGGKTVATTSALKSGHKKSCGCINSGLYSNNKRLYNVWRGMINRCENPKSNRYHRYGGRGICVCDEWHEFSSFLEWALDNGYDPNAKRGQCTIDRVDLDGYYCPENCRWVDNKTQMSRVSTNRYVEVDGKPVCLTEAARMVGISIDTVKSRLRRGWSVEDAIFIAPSRSANNRWNSSERLNLIKDT